jgi:hypothetical protein
MAAVEDPERLRVGGRRDQQFRIRPLPGCHSRATLTATFTDGSTATEKIEFDMP